MGKFYLSASQSPLIDGDGGGSVSVILPQRKNNAVYAPGDTVNLPETTFIIPINQELTNVGELPMTREDNKSGIDGVPVKGQGPEQPMGHIYCYYYIYY